MDSLLAATVRLPHLLTNAFRASACVFALLAMACVPCLAAGPGVDGGTDPIAQYLSRPRFYLIIAVTQIAAAGHADLPYAQVDAAHVKAALESAGYQPLSESAPLTGNDANYHRVDQLLRDIRQLPDRSSVIIYYSGHAWTDSNTKEVWLQLADNLVLGDQGIAVSTLLSFVRAQGWKGELAVVVDSCYSGKAAFGSVLQGETVVLASSDQEEPSRPISLPTGPMSAFTHAMLLAAGEQFDQANTPHDGLLTFQQVADFATSELIDWNANHLIDGPMNPRIFENTSTIVFKYDPSKAVALNTPLRKIILHKLIGESIGPPDAATPDSSAISPVALSEARATVAQLLPYFPDDPEKLALEKFSKGQALEGLTELQRFNESRVAAPQGGRESDLLLARLYSAAGFDTQASAMYTKVLSHTAVPSNELKLETAIALMRAKSFDNATSMLTEIVGAPQGKSASKLQALAWNSLGVIYTSKGNYGKAQSSYKFALQHVPPESTETTWAASINSNLANAYRLDKKFQDASVQYARTIDLHERAGSEPARQIEDLEKYSDVLSVTKRPAEAQISKERAQVLRAEIAGKF